MCSRIVCVAIGIVLLLPTVARADIVPQRGMAGVRLGDSTTDVRDTIGRAPDAIRRPRDQIRGRVLTYRYGSIVLTFNSDGEFLTSVYTRGTRQRTSSGVGVGSSDSAIDLLPGFRCATEYLDRHCYRGSFRAGTVVTEFQISSRSGRATSVVIGYVVD